MAEVSPTNSIGTKITQALKTGSGVDIVELATTLAEAETQPRMDSISAKQESATLSISGFGALKSALTNLKSSFGALTEKDQLLSKSISSQNDNRASAKISSQITATAGTTTLVVSDLAENQVVYLDNDSSDVTNEKYTSLTQNLSDDDFTITINSPSGGGANVITVSTHTPQGIIDAINAADINGIKARALNFDSSGTSFNIVVEGKTGAANSFDISSSLANFGEITTQTAADLDLTVNGIQVYRPDNSPSNLIPGVDLDIKNTGTTSIVVSEDTAGLRNSLDNLILDYNTLVDAAEYLTGDENEEDELAGSLSNEKNVVNTILSSIRGLLDKVSSTPSNGFDTLRDLGVYSELGGKLKINETIYAAAIKDNFSDIRTMLTADTNGQLPTSALAKGLALDSQNVINTFINDTGTIKYKIDSAEDNVSKYEEDLLDLQERLEKIKSRYLAQFAAMETIVQRSKNTSEYLSGQIKAMQGMYSND